MADHEPDDDLPVDDLPVDPEINDQQNDPANQEVNGNFDDLAVVMPAIVVPAYELAVEIPPPEMQEEQQGQPIPVLVQARPLIPPANWAQVLNLENDAYIVDIEEIRATLDIILLLMDREILNDNEVYLRVNFLPYMIQVVIRRNDEDENGQIHPVYRFININLGDACQAVRDAVDELRQVEPRIHVNEEGAEGEPAAEYLDPDMELDMFPEMVHHIHHRDQIGGQEPAPPAAPLEEQNNAVDPIAQIEQFENQVMEGSDVDSDAPSDISDMEVEEGEVQMPEHRHFDEAPLDEDMDDDHDNMHTPPNVINPTIGSIRRRRELAASAERRAASTSGTIEPRQLFPLNNEEDDDEDSD